MNHPVVTDLAAVIRVARVFASDCTLRPSELDESAFAPPSREQLEHDVHDLLNRYPIPSRMTEPTP